PADALKELNGRVWEKAIAKSELEDHDRRYLLISNKLVAGRPIIHVLSDTRPEEGFAPAEPNLEDVFFSAIRTADLQPAA
ncbi:MAG TPA: ABC transporter ATP-binding protein, partial [Flavobacteriales bacterium]|nr:ABC transporter ATP-binding protein [Flavobacteriales bacterium]